MKLIKQLSVIFLITLLLLSTSGVTVRKMVCLASGSASYALTKFSCGEEESDKNCQNNSIEEKCCSFSSAAFNLSVPTVLTASSDFASFNYTATNFQPPSFLTIIKKVIRIAAADLTPPLIHKNTLSVLQVFLI